MAYKETKGPIPPELGWQQFFTDEKLKKILEAVLKNNRDLRRG